MKLKMSDQWWDISINKLIGILKGTKEYKLSKAYDIKYGDYNYENDLRNFSLKEFEAAFNYFIEKLSPNQNVLVCGANSGYEIKYLGGLNIQALDLSTNALLKLRNKYPYVKTIRANMNLLSFQDETIDMYINLRSIQSKGADLRKSIQEAVRVVKSNGYLLFSIPDGYYFKNEILKGMWDSVNQKLDKDLPMRFVNQILDLLNEFNAKDIEIKETTSEIFVFARK